MSDLDDAMKVDDLREALAAVLVPALGSRRTPAGHMALEASALAVFQRFHHERGLPLVTTIVLLVSRSNPAAICLFDETTAPDAIESGEWVDPLGRFSKPVSYRACGGIRRGAAVVVCECGGVREARAGCTTH